MTRRDGLAAVLHAYATGDLGAAAACFASDATYREARGETIRGRAAIAAHFARFSASGNTWVFTADEVIRDGRNACVAYRFRMSEGRSAPGRERAGCAVVRFDECDHIIEWREYEG